MDLTDHQKRLLELVDCVRFGEIEKLGAYEYHLLRNALGEGDVVVNFEMQQAVGFYTANPEAARPDDYQPRWVETWIAHPITKALPA